MLMKRDFSFVEERNDTMMFHNEANEKIVAKIFVEEKLNIDALKEFLAFLYDYHISHGIIIYSSMITSSSKKVLEHLSNIYIEQFDILDMQYDLTMHNLYCEHEKISDDEKKEIQPFLSKLPILLRNDPVSKYFNFQKNDIIRIRRKNDTIAYRLVR